MERFLKNVIWTPAEGGYSIQVPFNANHIIKVEFSNDALCWAEVCWLDRSKDWHVNSAEWEIFCPTPADLGCDIYLNKLTAEELCHITEALKTHTSHTFTPAPSETSEEIAISKPEQIHVLSPVQPSTGEQQLAAWAELLHISPNSLIVKAPPMVGPTWTRVCFTLGPDFSPSLFQGTALLCFLPYAFLIDHLHMSDVRWYRVVLVRCLLCSRFVYAPLRAMFLDQVYIHLHGSWYPMMDYTSRVYYGLFPHVCWCSMGFPTIPLLLVAVLGSQYFSYWYDNTGQCGLWQNV